MDLASNLALGFGVAFTLQNLVFALAGAVLGTLIGVLPGVSVVATLAMLLPALYALDAMPALIMLAGICYGAQHGAAARSILVNAPGAASPAAAAIDGHQMARQGRSGAALAAAAIGLFFAGCVGTLIIAALARPLTAFASQFGPAEYVALIVLGLIGAAVLAAGSLVKAVAMVLLGLLLAQVNTDPLAGAARYGLAFPELAGGIGLVGLAMGLFGLADVVARLGMPAAQREVFSKKLSGRWPTRQDVMDAWPAMVRGTAVGSVLGLLPGASARLAAVAAYTVEKEVPAKAGEIAFGRGNIRGVAGPEAANSAGAQTSFIPLLTLGVAPSAVTALMMGAMTIKGIHPGPQLLTANPQWFWGLVASMWVGHLMLAILNLPLIGLWGKLLAVPYRLVFPAMIVLCCIGLYSLNNRSLDVFVGAAFAVVGYFFHKLGCEPAPLLLGYILWPTMEENLRRALLASDGDWGTFLARPLSAGLLIAAALMVFVVRLPTIKKQRQTVFGDDL